MYTQIRPQVCCATSQAVDGALESVTVVVALLVVLCRFFLSLAGLVQVGDDHHHVLGVQPAVANFDFHLQRVQKSNQLTARERWCAHLLPSGRFLSAGE